MRSGSVHGAGATAASQASGPAAVIWLRTGAACGRGAACGPRAGHMQSLRWQLGDNDGRASCLMLGKRAGWEARPPVTTRLCADLLYVFKAARRAARAADSAHSPSLWLALPLRRRHASRLARRARNPLGRQLTYSSYRVQSGVSCSRCPIVRGRAEPVKAVCDCRTTAPVELPRSRTRKDGLDRTYPVREMAAIGSMGTSGQDG
jgi:hypothetical protein